MLDGDVSVYEKVTKPKLSSFSQGVILDHLRESENPAGDKSKFFGAKPGFNEKMGLNFFGDLFSRDTTQRMERERIEARAHMREVGRQNYTRQVRAALSENNSEVEVPSWMKAFTQVNENREEIRKKAA